MKDVEADWEYCSLCLMLYIDDEVSYECLGVLSWDAQVCVVGCRAFCFREPALAKCLVNNLWYLLRGTMLTSVPGSILLWRTLLPWLVMICSMLQRELCPSDVVSVTSLPSLHLDWDLIIEKKNDQTDAFRGSNIFCRDGAGICKSTGDWWRHCSLCYLWLSASAGQSAWASAVTGPPGLGFAVSGQSGAFILWISAVVGPLAQGSEVSSTVAAVAFFAIGRAASLRMGVSAAGALDVSSYHVLVEWWGGWWCSREGC